MGTKTQKPDYMKVKLKSRKQIAQYLLGALQTVYDRESRNGGHYIFCIDCDNSSADFSFNHLLKAYQGSYDGNNSDQDPVWLEACRRKYAEDFTSWDPDSDDAEEDLAKIDFDDSPDSSTLYEWGNEDVQNTFGTNNRSGKPDDDFWNTLWNGDQIDIRFQYVGANSYSCDDTMCLKSFESYECTEDDIGQRLKIDAEDLKPDLCVPRRGEHGVYWKTISRGYNPDETGPLSWKELVHLCEFIQTFKYWFEEAHGYRKEMEYQAAWAFFENVCSELPNPTRDALSEAAHEEHRKRSIAAFLEGMGGSRSRSIRLLTGHSAQTLHGPRRRIIRGLRLSVAS